ncbi:DNA alkylation repair protein [Frigidibacter sp. ROC022]|uniref:DNA alkylation repair protein n=1 Tax=Frigidibacter sp. ROC022 TaxID=2971796 RepID=UPI00215B1C75|nr:DNA alkylation repair protein [Frigidibacter sp. ROC022]MCR8725482.1 DNA alkylation repair protein [Frigidibacter sp. ROC022]
MTVAGLVLTPEEALDQMAALGDTERARGMEAYHKVARPYLGIAMPDLNALTQGWRREMTVPDRVALARGLWSTNVFEARVGAAKLLTQARMTPDIEVWRQIADWVAEFDSWAIADHTASAGGRRLLADPTRLDEVETWLARDHLWSRRAALVMTLPWAKLPNPKPAELDARERILGWAAGLVADRNWFIQKAVAWWLRDLSKHAPDRVRAFLDRHGAGMKGFARKEAGKHLK